MRNFGILYLAVLSAALVSGEDEPGPLEICAEPGKFPSRPSCHADRIVLATKRHVTKLVHGTKKTSLKLACPLCYGENPQEFQWVWIKRQPGSKSIFVYEEPSMFGTGWRLVEEMLTLVETTSFDAKGGANPCLINATGELIFSTFDPQKDAGTYVCQAVDKEYFETNFIWYHIDYIQSYEEVSDSVTLKVTEELHTTADSLKEIEGYKNLIEKELADLPDYEDEVHYPMFITSTIHNNLGAVEGCGELPMRIDRMCAIRMLPDININLESIQEADLIYAVLRSAFLFLYSYLENPTIKEMEAAKVAARRIAKELGFPFFADDKNIYAPCRYSLFHQLPNLEGRFRPISKRGMYTSITFTLSCGESNPLDLINLALQRDMKRMKFAATGIQDVRFMKVEKVFLQGTKNVTLMCTVDTGNGSQAIPSDVLWRREKSKVTMFKRTLLFERIYVTDTFRLAFEYVEINDSDVYNCYTRDMRNPRRWKTMPTLSYRLRVERSSYKWPTLNDFLIGLVMLSFWSVCVAGIWISLLGYDKHIYTAALRTAEARIALKRLPTKWDAETFKLTLSDDEDD